MKTTTRTARTMRTMPGAMAAVAAAMLAAPPALAQASFPTAAAGVRAPGYVPLQCDATQKNCAPPTRGPATAANSQPVTPASDGAPFPTSVQDMAPVTVTPASANGAVLLTADMTGYAALSLQPTGTFAGTLSFYYSDDGSVFTNGAAGVKSLTNVVVFATGTSGETIVIPKQHRYIRVTVTSYTSGTIGAAAYLLSSATFVTTQAQLMTGSNTIGDVLRSNMWTETPVLTANGTTTGVSRSYATSATRSPFNAFSCFFRSDQASATNGARIEGSNDSFATSFVVQSATIAAAAAGAPGTALTSRPFFAAQRCVYVNGAVAATALAVQSSYGE